MSLAIGFVRRRFAKGLNHEEHQGYEAEGQQAGLLVVQPLRGLTTARIPTAGLSQSRHPGRRDPEPMSMMAQA